MIDRSSANPPRQRRAVRILISVAISIAVLALAGFGYESVAAAADERRFPAPGDLIDVGGHRLHLHCRGEGSPTVVLEAGAQSFSTSWAWVQEEVAQVTRACAYDRAGLGWSEPGPGPRDAAQIAQELAVLLDHAGVQDPLVLAGHSLGGLFNRRFAFEHGDRVVGLILVDARHPDYMELSPNAEEEMRGAVPMVEVARGLAHFGVLRLLGDVFGVTEGMAPDAANAALAKTARPGLWAATLAEVEAFPHTHRQVRESGTLSDQPLVVISRDMSEPESDGGTESAWRDMQLDMLKLSAEARHVVVRGSTHVSLLTNREHAQQVASEIVEVVERVRRTP